MKHRSLFFGVFIVLTVCANPLGSARFRTQQVNASDTRAGSIVVTVQMIQGRPAYAVDSHAVSRDALLDVFGKLVLEGRRDQTVLVFVDVNSPLNQLGWIYGVASKAGFTKFRDFIVTEDRNTMSEVRFCDSVPYSPNPPSSACVLVGSE